MYHLVAAVILLYGRVTVRTLPGVTLDVVLAGQGARHHLQPLLSEPEGYDKITTMFFLNPGSLLLLKEQLFLPGTAGVLVNDRSLFLRSHLAGRHAVICLSKINLLT